MGDLNFTLVIIHDNLSWSPQSDEGIQTQLALSAQTRTEKYSEEVSPLSSQLSGPAEAEPLYDLYIQTPRRVWKLDDILKLVIPHIRPPSLGDQM